VIVLKSRREIALMRAAGQVVAKALAEAAALVEPGVRTRQIDAAIEATFCQAGAEPLFKGVPGKVPFPAASCISVNEEVVHGIPGERILRAGDLVSIDTGCRLAGWCADSAWTFSVGPVDELKARLLSTGQRVLELAIDECSRRQRWSEIAARMVEEVRRAGFSMVEEYVGHGIGREMHEDPQVPNYVSRSLAHADFALQPGLVLAIEPMVNAGGKSTETNSRDHWTVVTRDRLPSVHFEHTVALTAEGPLVLTAAADS
jgi:methionyl aminopeptidase